MKTGTQASLAYICFNRNYIALRILCSPESKLA